MEVAGVVLGQAPCFSSSVGGDAFNYRQFRSFPAMKVSCLNVKSAVASVGFDDKSHLQYYYNNDSNIEPLTMVVKEKEIESKKKKKKKKEMKKKLKLLKGLSKNLSIFSDLGFPDHQDQEQGLDHQVKGHMISEATEVLLGELEKLKAEEMETKRKKKEEKAKKKAAAKMMDSSESSCSSSESEGDCCEKKVVDMKTIAVTTPQEVTPAIPSLNVDNYKIEVCMGGKCKKSGAEMLLENFQKAVGEEGGGGGQVVVGCSKCMGKCKDAPNVRVRSSSSSSSDGGPLCMGVGLEEDVDSIVRNLFGGSRKCGSDMVPGMSAA